MPNPTSVKGLDLSPIPGKTYFDFDREWREEFIYFLMVDRFHDDTDPHAGARPAGPRLPRPDDFSGGTIRGITRNLDYIAGLGCTAIWLSPVFETNANATTATTSRITSSIDPAVRHQAGPDRPGRCRPPTAHGNPADAGHPGRGDQPLRRQLGVRGRARRITPTTSSSLSASGGRATVPSRPSCATPTLPPPRRHHADLGQLPGEPARRHAA